MHKLKRTLACDPGVTKGHAIAIFDGLHVERVEMVKDFNQWAKAFAFDHDVLELAMEMPVVRRTSLQRGRQSDIVNLASSAGGVMGICSLIWPNCTIIVYKPEEWKGQLPKKVGCERVKSRLTASELSGLPKRISHDLLDAIGIGFRAFDPSRRLR